MVAFLVFIATNYASADIIHLKNGNKVEGVVVKEEKETVEVKLDIGTITLSTNEIALIEKSTAEETTTLERRWEEKRTDTGEPPVDFHTRDKQKIAKNDSDDTWEMTIQGIMPMYEDPDPKRGKSQKEMDETVLKLTIQEAGSKESAVAKIIESAWAYFNGGYPNIAMRKFNQAWSLNPKNAEVYYGFGCILSNRKDLDDAIKMYTKAVDLNPKYYEAYANRGLDYCSKNTYDKAILDFTKAIEIRPNEAQTYNDRAVAYFFRKEYNKCWEDVRKAQALGYNIHPEFLKSLQKASGIQK